MKNSLKFWLGTLTVFLLAPTPSVVPVGGSVASVSAATVSESGGSVCIQTVTNSDQVSVSKPGAYCVITFERVGTTNWTVPTGVTTAEVLVVAGGGGGGGSSWTGGGGAGGVLHRTDAPVSSVIAITVGGGGLAGSGNSTGGSGGNSLFGTVTALGGGGGGAYSWSNSGTTGQGSSGGSGGGSSEDNSALVGGASSQTAPTGWTAYGNAGGAMSEGGGSQAGSGGGGAGAPGGAVPAGSNRLNDRTAGDGGDGREFDITGSNVFYAGGGGGGTYDDAGDTCSTGGSGGGGAGACHSRPAVAGTDGLGGGGGGAWSNNSAAGGSGVVIVRYSLVPEAPVNATATATSESVSLSWTAPSHTGGITPVYYIEYKSGAGAWTCWNSCGVSSATSRTITGLTDGTTYSFRISATNATVAPSRSTAEVSAFSLAASSNAVTYNSTATLSTSGGSGTGAVSYSVTSGDCSISGTTVTATGGTGSCVITATKAADASYAEATSSVTLTLSKAAQSSLSISVDDSALDYGDTATLSSSGGSGTGAVTFSVDSGDCSISGTTVTATGGTTDCVISAVKAADDDYLQASSANTVTISISKASQTITFASISNKSYGAASFTVSPTSGSGLLVSVSSSTPLVCTTSGLAVTLVGAGTCTLTANQAGNSFYSSATGVSRSFTVSAKAITVSVVVSDKVYDATTSATVSSGTLSGVVSGDVVSFVAGNAAAAFGSATVGPGKAVTVTLDGDELTGSDAGNYSLSLSGSPTASITAKPVTVNVVPAGKTYDGTQTATVSSATVVGEVAGDTVSADTSKISVTFDAPGAGTQSASATLASGVLTGADAGNYSASVGTVSSAVISKANQASLSFTSSSSTLFGQTLTLVASGGSGSGAISYSASGDCTISGAVITPTGAGSCSVSATRAADSNYNVSSQATQTVTIAKANQSINFTSSVPVSAVSGTTYTPTATATSGLTPSFSITTGSGTVCSLASGVVTFLTSGTCVITAAQGGDSDYNAASSVTQTIVAGKINQTISFPAISGKDFDDAAFLAGATVSSGRTVTYATSTGSVCAVNASTGLISIKTIGDCTVTASSAGDASYAAASDVSRTFTISPVVAGKPSVTSVSFGNSSVTVAFGAPGANGGDSIDAYQVVATSSGGSVTKPDCSTTSPCTITGLTNGESYTLTVAAINAAGVGPASDASPAVIPATIPDAVSALSTTPGDTQLVVTWTPLTNAQLGGGSFTRYEVSIRVRGQAWSSPVTADGSNNLGTRTTSSYTFTGLTNGTAYDVKVVALTSVNGSALSSNTATALGVPATAPVAPTGLAATALSNTTAVASWSAPVDDGGSAITGYSVNLSCTFVNATDTFCELSGLSAGSTVTVSVGATNLMGTGSTVSVSITMPGGSSGSPGGGSSGGAASPAAVAATNPPVLSPRRIIVPAQPIPIPRLFSAPVRILPERGFDPDAGSKARIAGQPATVTKRPLGDGGLSVEAGAFQLGITMSTPEARVSSASSSGSRSDVSIPTGQSTKVTGGGLLPGSNLQVWLPGVTGENPRELARIPVKADGTFESELSFTARQSETPLPIGRQVLQVTGFDEDGNQTVVDMTINIGQGAPAPEPNRAVNSLPDLAPGQSLATSAGTPETVTIEARPEDREVAVLSGEWSFLVSLPEEAGVVEEAGSGATVTLIQARTATVSGDGFQPDTRVDIWLFSDPTLLGSVIVSADGSFTGEVYLDVRYAIPGEHTLQLQGVADDGFIKAANLGVVVQEPVEFTTENASSLLLWVGLAVILLLLAVLIGVTIGRRRQVRH